MSDARLGPWWSVLLTATFAAVLCMAENVEAQAPTADEGEQSQSSASAVAPDFDDGDDEMALFELDIPVVVTATRRPQRLAQVPYAMSIVTADDIRHAGARSIPDALRLVPGVDVADLSFGNAAVSARGFHGLISNQVLVLVDGRQLFDSFFGGTLWASWPFQLEDIARIEVIRGPGGVTWGANAMNGVINIITKDPTDQLGFTLTSSGGSRGTFKQHVGYATTEGKLRWRLSGEYEASDGFRKGGSLLGNLNDDFKGGRIALHGVYEASSDDTFTFSLGSAVVDGGFPSTPLAGFGGKRQAGSQASFVVGTWQHANGPNNSHDLTVYVNDFHASPGVSAIDYRYQQFGLLFSETSEPDEGRTRTWGFDTRMDLVDAGNASPRMLEKNFVTAAIVGFYAQEEWRFAPRWTFDLGGRIDYDTYGGFQPSARASLSYEVAKDSIIYSAVSRAFQMPSAAGRFTNFPLLNGLTQVTADRGFDLTTLIAYEVGYRGRIGDKLDLTANAFWHDYEDVQAFTPKLGPPGLIQYNFGNAGSADLYGFEMDAKYAASDKLTLLANYTFQQLNWSASQPFTGRDYITPPKHKFMVGARYDATDDLHFSSNLFYVDAVKSPNPANPFVPRRIDPYYRLDLVAEYEFQDDDASITVGVKNLLDRDHYEGSSLFLNDAQTPRMIFAELRWTIK